MSSCRVPLGVTARSVDKIRGQRTHPGLLPVNHQERNRDLRWHDDAGLFSYSRMFAWSHGKSAKPRDGRNQSQFGVALSLSAIHVFRLE